MNDCVVVLFRNDLRVVDHLPLTRACHSGLPVIALFVFEKYLFTQTTHYRFPKTGPFRTKFLRESVEDLKKQLDDLHIPFFVQFGVTHEIISNLKNELKQVNYQPTTVYYSDEYGSEEQEVIHQLKEYHSDLRWNSTWTKGLLKFEDVPIISELPRLFTTFRNEVEQNLHIEKPLPIPTVVARSQNDFYMNWYDIQTFQVSSWETLQLTEPSNDARAPFVFKGGSSNGLQRLNHYFFDIKAISTYKETRNGMTGNYDSSRLSPWLANGSISAKTIYAQLVKYENEHQKNDSTYWLFFELLWREFFLLNQIKYGDKLFVRSGIQNRIKNWSFDADNRKKWMEGRTGYALVDASMEELRNTGFTSNRARQNAASLLTQTWKIDWLFGAEYYESLLIDYDSALTYGNWQYIAGIGNDARGDRVFDVMKQAERYDPEGSFVRQWKKEDENE